MKNNVVIRKQKISIKTGNEALALKLRKRVNDSLQYELLDVYDSVFNSKEFDGLDDFFIDSINLNIGSCTETEFFERLPKLIRQALIEHLHHPSSTKDSIQILGGNDSQSESLKAGNAYTALLYFLQFGIFPWWFTGDIYRSPKEIASTLGEPELAALVKSVLEWQQNQEWQPYENPAAPAVTRFLNILTEDSIRHTLPVVLKSILTSKQQEEKLLLLFDVMVTLFKSRVNGSGRSIKHELLNWLLTQKNAAYEDVSAAFVFFFFQRYRNELNLKAINLKEEIPAAVRQFINNILIQTDKNQPLKSTGTDKKITRRTTKDQEVFEDGVYVSNAGLIILHPFLAALFQACKLINETGLFNNEEACFRAIALLNYLHTGNTNYEEHELAFNKVLCGLDITAALPVNVDLTDTEIKECDELLTMVVQYWAALKGAGIDTIRESFFTRKGKLSFKANNCLLQVERHTIDVLIDRLPWGFSTVKLPWHNLIIYTEW